MFQKIQDKIENTKMAIAYLKEDAVESIGFLIPIVIELTAIICGVVAYVLFIVRGGYTNQIALIKEAGARGVFDGFTTGTTGMIVSGVVGKVLVLLLFIQAIIILCTYFKNAKVPMKVAMVVDLAAGLVMAVATTIMFAANLIKPEKLPGFLIRMAETGNLKTISMICAGIWIVTVICFFAFILRTAGCRQQALLALESILVSFVIVPLLFLLIQNIIPLVIIAIVTVIMIFGGKMVLGGSGSESGGGGHSFGGHSKKSATFKSSDQELPFETNSSHNEDNKEDPNEAKIRAGNFVKTNNSAYIPGFIKLYRVHGDMHDYVITEGSLGSSELCSLYDLEHGNFHIYEAPSKREIPYNTIPWKR